VVRVLRKIEPIVAFATIEILVVIPAEKVCQREHLLARTS
jgi:hypothetical protein